MRSHYNRPIRDDSGRSLTNCTVRLLRPGTTTPISQSVYVDDYGSPTKGDWWHSTTGEVDFYLDQPEVVDIVITPLEPGQPQQVWPHQWIASPFAPEEM